MQEHLGLAEGGAGAFEEAHQRSERHEDAPPQADGGQLAPGNQLVRVRAGDAEQPGGLGNRNDEASSCGMGDLHPISAAPDESSG